MAMAAACDSHDDGAERLEHRKAADDISGIELYLEHEPSVPATGGAGRGQGDAPKPQLFGRLEERGPTGAPAVAGAAAVAGTQSTDPQSATTSEQEAKLVRLARIVSVVSIAASLVVAVCAFSIAIAEEVLSLIGFGGESLLDAISSALVMWRYKKPKKRHFVDGQAAEQRKLERDAKRERNSSLGIGVTFVVLGVLLLVSAAAKLIQFVPEEHIVQEREGADYGAILAWPSAIFFGALAYVKYGLARSLGSQVLEKDAFCSALGAVLALIVAIASLVEELASDSPQSIELVDVIAGTIIAVIILREGGGTIRENMQDAEAHQPLA